jgi:hypothetical protein
VCARARARVRVRVRVCAVLRVGQPAARVSFAALVPARHPAAACVSSCSRRGGVVGRYDSPASLVPLNKFQQIGNAVSPRL